jgi:hypothetical protein
LDEAEKAIVFDDELHGFKKRGSMFKGSKVQGLEPLSDVEL